MPRAVVVVCVTATVGLTVVARHLLAGSGFFAVQRACVIVLAGGSSVSALLYAIAGIRALRRVRAWQHEGRTASAGGALCGLAMTALVVALPILLAVLLPQHPPAVASVGFTGSRRLALPPAGAHLIGLRRQRLCRLCMHPAASALPLHACARSGAPHAAVRTIRPWCAQDALSGPCRRYAHGPDGEDYGSIGHNN